MLKIKKSKHLSKKALSAGLLICLILVGITLFYLKKQSRSIVNTHPSTTQASEGIVNLGPPTTQEKQQVEDNKTSDNKTPTPTSVSVDKSAKISEARWDSNIKSMIVQTQLYGDGWLKCTLDLTNDSQKITKVADTLYQSTFSTCLGFSVGSNEFPNDGEWKIILSATNSDGKTYSSSQESIVIIK